MGAMHSIPEDVDQAGLVAGSRAPGPPMALFLGTSLDNSAVGDPAMVEGPENSYAAFRFCGVVGCGCDHRRLPALYRSRDGMLPRTVRARIPALART